VLKVKHITQVLQERSGGKKGNQAKRQERKLKEYQPLNKDKYDKKKQLLEGNAATTRKKTLCVFLDSHSLRNGFNVFGVKGGPTTILLNMNEVLIITYLTFVNSMCDIVLILNNCNKV
jgi:hypothetical protein